MRKLLGNRFVRGFLFLIAFLVTGIVLAYSITSYLGRREWAATRKALEARGEKLSILEMAPPPLADELNFFAAPAFMELADYEVVQDGEYTKTNYRVPLENQQLRNLKKTLRMPFPKGTRTANELTNFAAIAAHYRSQGRVMETDRSDAAAVLEALEPARPLMEEIVLYAERPGARFPIRYEDGLSTGLPHIEALLTIASFLVLRAQAEMELGRGADASRDIMLILRLADAVRDEPYLISQLVRFGMLKNATLAIWEGVARGVWNDAELAAFQERLSGYDLYRDAVFGLRGERASVLYALEASMRKGELGKLISLVGRMSDGTKAGDLGAFASTGFYPRGWIYADLAFFANVHQRWIDALEKRQIPIRPADFDFLASEKAQWEGPAKPRHVLSLIWLQAMKGTVETISTRQTELEETCTALALERYRLAHGEVPETLDGLVPEFLKAVPIDVMTGQPLSYRRLAPDDFLLWSIGWDQVDDGALPMDWKTKKGDVVWMRLPKSARPASP
jgi:hypothetical protein